MTISIMEKLREQFKNIHNYNYGELIETFEKLPLQRFEDYTGSELEHILNDVFTEEKRQLFEAILQLIRKIPYSVDYYRRSYRAPNSFKFHNRRIFQVIYNLLKHKEFLFYEVFQSKGNDNYINGISQFIADNKEPLFSQELFPYIIALKLNAHEEKLEEIVREILWKNGRHPHYSRELIRGIMMSDHEEMQQLLADVLLAAKNQEGARQVITESIDEGTVSSQIKFMKVILEHDLLRFSSVARAVDVWFGLGYDTADKRQLKYVVETSYAALQDAELVEKLLASDSNLDVFIALWCIGSNNAEDVLARLDELFTKKDYIQQTVMYALRNMDLPDESSETIQRYLVQTDNLVTFMYGFYLIVNRLPHTFSRPKDDENAKVHSFMDDHPWFKQHPEEWFEKIAQFNEQIGKKEEQINGSLGFIDYSFSTFDLFKLQIVLGAYLKKEAFFKELGESINDYPTEHRYYFYHFVPNYLERLEWLVPALKDRAIGTRLLALHMMLKGKAPLELFEKEVPALLTLKTGEIRIALIHLLKMQPIEKIETLAEKLLASKKELVRLGMIEVLVEVKDKLTKDWSKVIKTPTEKETQLLAQLSKQEEKALLEPLEPIKLVQEPMKEPFFTFKDFIAYDYDALKEKLQPLRELIESHAEVSYEVQNYTGGTYSNLIGQHLVADLNKPEAQDSIDFLPLAEVWVNCLKQSDLTALDISCYLYAKHIERGRFRSLMTSEALAFFNTFITIEQQGILCTAFEQAQFEQQLSTILFYTVKNGDGPLQQQLLDYLGSLEKPFDYVAFCSSMLLDFVEQGYDNALKESALVYTDRHYTVIDIDFFGHAQDEMGKYAYNTTQVNQYFYTMAQLNDKVEAQLEFLKVHGVMIAYHEGILQKEHVRYMLLFTNLQFAISNKGEITRFIKGSPLAEEMLELIEEVRTIIIEHELSRGDMETPVSKAVKYLDKVDGDTYFIRILQALEGEKLGRMWSYNIKTRKDSLSQLLLNVTFDENLQKEQFFERLQQVNFSVQRLIETMLYNSKLIPLISEFIGWEGLEEVAWYFIAHTTESTNDYETAKIMEYSAVPTADFERGAFDRTWFLHALRSLDQKQFQLVYNAAKYASSGANHRRAQLYAKATLGELDEQELKSELAEKRNKDKLRAYSLIPADFEQAKERYLFFQQFLKESRKFGAQRRASEAEAVEMAVFNLAQQVASGNTTQFIWQMEQERHKELHTFFSPIEIEEVQLQLVQHGPKVELEVYKGGKALKSVPKKIAKDEMVLAIQEAKKELTEQYRRTRLQLEQSMCEETEFDSAIIEELIDVDSFAELLTKLIWRQNDQFFAIVDGNFVTIDGKKANIKGVIQIAHPAHFYAAKNWRAWQHFVFEQQWQQPFKQVFREFYIVTDDEKQAVYTNRLEGYQIQPKKALALLKSRGWKSGYYEPIRKISYHYNLITHLDFVNDFYTPAEVEAPTLHEIYFEQRLSHKKVQLGDVPAVHFSEVMRDIDLVVSVAHAGEVDPETSHSTIEMRAVIAEEMVKLFGFTNVKVTMPHLLIEGKLGNYSIHLGSGNVHQLGGTMIPVLAVPSQQRGRVFLPFIDEDPKTAEIMAKLLVFAEDDQISDPQIRKYIMK